MKFPTQVVVMGKTYKVAYTETMQDTDLNKKSVLWGQVDYQTRTIRVFVGKGDRKRQPADVLETLLHEIIHAVLSDNKLIQSALKDGVEENFVDNLGCALADTLARNGLIKLQ
jgi:hypothetical protein